MLVRVYRNLNTGTLSLQSKVDGKWKVTAYPTSVTLTDVKFVVQAGGFKRAVSSGQRNVHAFAEGTLSPDASHVRKPLSVRYNHNRGAQFTIAKCGTAITSAAVVTLASFDKHGPYSCLVSGAN